MKADLSNGASERTASDAANPREISSPAYISIAAIGRLRKRGRRENLSMHSIHLHVTSTLPKPWYFVSSTIVYFHDHLQVGVVLYTLDYAANRKTSHAYLVGQWRVGSRLELVFILCNQSRVNLNFGGCQSWSSNKFEGLIAVVPVRLRSANLMNMALTLPACGRATRMASRSCTATVSAVFSEGSATAYV